MYRALVKDAVNSVYKMPSNHPVRTLSFRVLESRSCEISLLCSGISFLQFPHAFDVAALIAQQSTKGTFP